MAAPLLTEESIREETAIQDTLKNIKHVIIVMSGKGGVGKSTVSSNLAMSLSMKGFKTGVMDIDITGPNIPKMFAVEDRQLMVENEKLIPVAIPPSLKLMSMAFLLQSKDTPVLWRGPVKMGAIKQFIEDVNWGDLDYLVIDMPPGTGDEALSIVQLIPKADGMVIVTTPQDVALLDSRKSLVFGAETNIPIIGIIENMSGFVCPHCGEVTNIFKTGGGEATAKEMNVQFLGRIPIEPGIVDAGDSGIPIVLGHPDSASAKAFGTIVDKIVKTVDN
ncbi:MAG: Mrp/NBP35 family ATP-binding protein [Candidatus Methanomethylophilaceae archaeon]|jgi:Mrp family chromosome partitioning ATPase|nr:Mrp/NBP35 family ATP-binding protein [Thermoplasmata archaeon]MBR3409962.1 Mrp/NBP35 family ATP-binding protein [Candidatus Methanomethylophilaceae archaeon]MBR4181015.1 Mrp/NBP35 family ATP-binding protein [Candidatus Methanomethylophilaceae archaeon]MBR4216229.1 Mrp/NBP35 family ATP-binding protein [Candidatus Methanomethylophilaceae archaeon]MBR4697851.1 Mrp/NBP35 family ATP-binding protein [Candidatus Methanomethylophilaceae archaeon]